MDAGLRNQLNYELDLLQKMKLDYTRRLRQCDGAENIIVRLSKKHGKSYFYTKRRGSKHYKYTGNEKAVKTIRDAHFLREAIKRIDSNIELIELFLSRFLEYNMYAVNEAHTAVYRTDVPPMSIAYEHTAEAWKENRLSFQKKFPENYPDHKRERTSDGVMVKTISEALLYEMVKDAGLCGIYELPLVMKDYGPPMYPDLTVLSPVDMETEIIIEYVGRLDLPKYRDDFGRKVARYLANGYKIGENLFFVFGDAEGHIDSTQIKRVIDAIKNKKK